MNTITLNISVDKEFPAGLAEPQMRDTLALLLKADALPIRKLSITLEVLEEADAIDERNDLKVLLGARPLGIDATIELKGKEDIERMRMVKVTPMDVAIREAEGTWRE